MRTLVLIIAMLALLAPALAWAFIDGPTALFFLVASTVVLGCAAMPVIFSVVTRRKGSSRDAIRDAETISLEQRHTRP